MRCDWVEMEWFCLHHFKVILKIIKSSSRRKSRKKCYQVVSLLCDASHEDSGKNLPLTSSSTYSPSSSRCVMCSSVWIRFLGFYSSLYTMCLFRINQLKIWQNYHGCSIIWQNCHWWNTIWQNGWVQEGIPFLMSRGEIFDLSTALLK